jgi:DNA-binding FrmR family transcriptional regulator
MRRQMIEHAAYEVATQIRAVEDSIDATLIEIAELQSRMMRVNSVAQVGPAAIHAALEELSAAFSKLIAARGSVVGCHTQLVEAKGKVPGLRAVSFGDQECPKFAQADLRVVA